MVTVINIMDHAPAYHLLSQHKTFIHSWIKPDGESIGIVNYEWPDQIGQWVIKGGCKDQWEVWQPDDRVDREYEHTFDNGMIHRLFPAQNHTYRFGFLRPRKYLYSDSIVKRLKNLSGEKTILVMHGTNSPFIHKILETFSNSSTMPMIICNHGVYKSPLGLILESRHPATILGCFSENRRIKKLYNQLDAVIVQNSASIREARSVYKGKIEQITMGCDFDFWLPFADISDKNFIRSQLNIALGKRVFMCAAAFKPLKRLDYVIRALHSLRHRSDFCLLLVGQGDLQYTQYLKNLAYSMLSEQQVVFHPYTSGEGLRNLYWASDIFVSASTTEGGPVSVMEAMACGLPVVSTPIGGTFDLLKKYNSVTTLPMHNVQSWFKVFQKLLDDPLPQPLNRAIAQANFDWPQVARKFVSTFDESTSRYGII